MSLYTYWSGLSFVDIVLLSLFIFAFVVQMFIYLYYYTGIVRHNKRLINNKIQVMEDQPPISVIICAKNESENLANFLPLVLEQDYPNYEVIVVNDGSTDESDLVLKNLKERYSHLYYTYVPEQTQIISRKKLALTIGIKAAKNEILLFTDADCRPQSTQWISAVAAQFTPTTDFVLGYGAYLPNKGFLSRMISYDTLFIAMQYLGFAFRDKPYMGVGRNLAYRKQVFFAHKGFAGTLHVASGDDDLFVNMAANKYNTRIIASANSCTCSIPKTSFADWYHQKERHLTTAPMYNSKSKTRVLLEPISRTLFYLTLLALISDMNIISLGVVGLFFLIRYLTQLLVINITASKLKERHFYGSILILDLFLPLITLFLLIFGQKKSFAWK